MITEKHNTVKTQGKEPNIYWYTMPIPIDWMNALGLKPGDPYVMKVTKMGTKPVVAITKAQ